MAILPLTKNQMFTPLVKSDQVTVFTSLIDTGKKKKQANALCSHGRRQRGPWPPGFSIILNRGLNVLFFGLFLLPPPRKKLHSAIFRYFLLIFSLFFRCPPPLEIFLPTPLCAVM